MKKYTYKDWFSGKISLLYSPIKIGSEVNRVGWEEIKYTDIPKIKKAQKELFKLCFTHHARKCHDELWRCKFS